MKFIKMLFVLFAMSGLGSSAQAELQDQGFAPRIRNDTPHEAMFTDPFNATAHF